MHISFDFDYTLADSSRGTILCANYALETMGKGTRSDDAIKRTIGQSLDETYKILVSSHKEEELSQFSSLFLLKADEVAVDCIRFYESTKRVLTSLKQDSHYISIVSTKYSKRINAALKRDGLASLIDFVVGGDMVTEPKPSPLGLELAIQKSEIKKENTVYVGDSKSDGISSGEADIRFIGVLSGMTPREQLSEFQPVAIIENLNSLLRVVNNINS